MANMVQPQQDSMSQILPLILMDNMKSDGDTELKKKLDDLERQIRENKEEKQYMEVMREIKDLKTNMGKGDQFGAKEFLTMLLSKDEKMSEMWRQMSEKDREASQRQIETIMKMNTGSSSIGKIGEQIKELRALTETMGFGHEKEKSNPEIIKDLVGGVTQQLTQSQGFNDALSGLGAKFMSEASGQQNAKMVKIHAARHNPGVVASNPSQHEPTLVNPTITETVEATPANTSPHYDGMVSKDAVFPELIDISAGPNKAMKNPIGQYNI